MAIDPETLPDELTVTLRKPVTFAGETFTELRLREPTAGEMKQAGAKAGMDSILFLIFKVAAVPLGAVEMIGARDYRRAYDYLTGFISDGPATGDNA